MKGQYKMFNTEEMIDKETRQRMEGNRCKDCEKKIKMKGGHYCKEYKDFRTKTGWLKVRIQQPACIKYEKK